MDVGQFVLLPNILYLFKHYLLLTYLMVLFALPELIFMFTLENSTARYNGDKNNGSFCMCACVISMFEDIKMKITALLT